MKWISNNIKILSFIWWLIQGIFLLLNEIRCLFEYNSLITPELLVVSICLIIISFLLFIKNNKIILFLGIVFLLYSIISLIILTWIFILESHGNNMLGVFLVIPVLNIVSSLLMLKILRQETAPPSAYRLSCIGARWAKADNKRNNNKNGKI